MNKLKLPPILDASCGGRMMWFDKQNPLALYVDKRQMEPKNLCDGRMFEIKPDMLADFTQLPFPDNSFYLVVFDPPHLTKVNDDAYLAIKFSKLHDDWRDVLRNGFNECMRVLKPNGTLIFKWSDFEIPTADVISAIGQKPLFGHRSGRKMKTHWMTFMKLPEVI